MGGLSLVLRAGEKEREEEERGGEGRGRRGLCFLIASLCCHFQGLQGGWKQIDGLVHHL
jgi:hypothetical protein